MIKKLIITAILCSVLDLWSLAQEGRPALATETAESERVLKAFHDAFPHELNDWGIEDESKIEGVTWFHDAGIGVKYPFAHEYKISYKRQNVSEEERAKWQKTAVDVAGIQKMIEETECEIHVFVNTFFHEFTASSKTETKTISPFSLAYVGQHGARFFMGNGWKLAKTESLDDNRKSYELTMPINKAVPMTQIQSILITIDGSPTVLDYFLKNTDLKAIAALVGQNKINRPVSNSVLEKPLAKLLEGKNEIEFTLNGGDFTNRSFRLKHSEFGEFGYLNNNFPDPNVTENAITRVLVSEDDDFNTKNKTGFLDITIPFIRKMGEFDVYQGAEKASFAGGINCWDGCEYSFDAERMKISITRYDAVGGFIEGTFGGEVKVTYKANQPIDNDQKYRPNTQIKGRFKVRRKADR